MTNKYTIIIPPLILIGLIFKLYKDEIVNYNYRELLSDLRLGNWIFYSVIIIIVSQLAINFTMSKLFHSGLHTLSETVAFIPTSPIYTVLAAPIIEELFFRRILFKWLNTKLTFWISAPLSAIIFAIGHGSMVGLLGYIFVGISLCWIYKKTNFNLGVVVMIHSFINFYVVLHTSLHMNINI